MMMMMNSSNWLFFMMCMLNIVFDAHADDSCRLEHSKGVIDLTSLGRSDGSAAFPDIFPPDGSNFSLLLCFLLSETDDDRWSIFSCRIQLQSMQTIHYWNRMCQRRCLSK